MKVCTESLRPVLLCHCWWLCMSTPCTDFPISTHLVKMNNQSKGALVSAMGVRGRVCAEAPPRTVLSEWRCRPASIRLQWWGGRWLPYPRLTQIPLPLPSFLAWGLALKCWALRKLFFSTGAFSLWPPGPSPSHLSLPAPAVCPVV